MGAAMRDASLGQKKNKASHLFRRNQKGQFAIEAVLLMSILAGLFLALTNYAKEKQFMNKLIQKPIERVGRMAGYGTWNDECTAQGKSKKVSLGKCHPNSIGRALSSDPK